MFIVGVTDEQLVASGVVMQYRDVRVAGCDEGVADTDAGKRCLLDLARHHGTPVRRRIPDARL
jgi:hypothetical protein